MQWDRYIDIDRLNIFYMNLFLKNARLHSNMGKYIKIKQPNWTMKRINQGVSWTGAVKLGLFTPKLKKAINSNLTG